MEKDTLRMQFLSGVITESEYTAIINQEIEDTEKDSLNESMIGGIVGIGAINQIPSRAKADYETAFEHFLGEKYNLNEEEEKVEEVEEVEEGNEVYPISPGTQYLVKAYEIAEDMVKNQLEFPDEALSNEELFFAIVKALNDTLDQKAANLFAKNAGAAPDEYSMEEVKIEEGKEEVVLSNEILDFLEERGVIDPSDAQKVHKDLTSFLNKLSKNPTPDRIRSKSDYIAGIEENEEESN
jgi:hypothetical protein